MRVRYYRRRLFWPLAALALVASVGRSSAAVRALFVGVDHYQFSTAAQFSDLAGTVNDVDHIKEALQAVYGWPLDQAVASQCRSANAVSITLADACATRVAMLAALDQLIQASAPGDTVIFYYAGHGSQVVDSQLMDQPSGYNDTILPDDARDPGSAWPTEILDEELNVMIENANHIAGINIVAILDGGGGRRALARRRDRKEGVVGASNGAGDPALRRTGAWSAIVTTATIGYSAL